MSIPKGYYIPSLSGLLQNMPYDVQSISISLLTRGYAFVKLPSQMIQQIDDCLIAANEFFAQNDNYKKGFFKEPIFGYYDVAHKESFRVLTGSRINEQKYPKQLSNMKPFVMSLDNMMYTITKHLSPIIFPNLERHADVLDIPLMKTRNRWGMFDIARYHNDGARQDINCQEHFDPGLLSFSFRSTVLKYM